MRRGTSAPHEVCACILWEVARRIESPAQGPGVLPERMVIAVAAPPVVSDGIRFSPESGPAGLTRARRDASSWKAGHRPLAPALAGDDAIPRCRVGAKRKRLGVRKPGPMCWVFSAASTAARRARRPLPALSAGGCARACVLDVQFGVYRRLAPMLDSRFECAAARTPAPIMAAADAAAYAIVAHCTPSCGKEPTSRAVARVVVN